MVTTEFFELRVSGLWQARHNYDIVIFHNDLFECFSIVYKEYTSFFIKNQQRPTYGMVGFLKICYVIRDLCVKVKRDINLHVERRV